MEKVSAEQPDLRSLPEDTADALLHMSEQLVPEARAEFWTKLAPLHRAIDASEAEAQTLVADGEKLLQQLKKDIVPAARKADEKAEHGQELNAAERQLDSAA